jgi:hypothetical protein
MDDADAWAYAPPSPQPGGCVRATPRIADKILSKSVIGGRPDSEAHTNYALFARTERGRGGRFLLLDCSWCSSALSADSGLLQPEFDQHLYLVELSPSKALLQYSAPLYAKFTMQNASTPVHVPMLRRYQSIQALALASPVLFA